MASKSGPKPKPVQQPSIPWSTRNSSTSAQGQSKQKKPPAAPSPSASIILISPDNKVLLLHRVQTSSSFPSAHVFPGGNLEPSDGPLPEGDTNPARHADSATYRTGAIRELFEESGILLARKSSSQDSGLLTLPSSIRLEGRKAIHDGKISIHEWLKSAASNAINNNSQKGENLDPVLDTENLIPFTRWVTPTNVPKRFTTQMYIYFLPHPSQLTPNQEQSLSATSDEVETMAPEWRPAKEWLHSAQSGEIILFPPQFILLHFVSRFLDSSPNNNTSQSESESQKSRTALQRFITNTPNKQGDIPWSEKIICPTALSFTRKDGRTVLGLDKPGPELRNASSTTTTTTTRVIKGDDEYVVLVKFSKQGPREVEVRSRREVLEEERLDDGKSKL